jgi:hypothetical protein
MSWKRLTFRALAREKTLRGATALVDAVRVTLAPKSKWVLTITEVPEPRSEPMPAEER